MDEDKALTMFSVLDSDLIWYPSKPWEKETAKPWEDWCSQREQGRIFKANKQESIRENIARNQRFKPASKLQNVKHTFVLTRFMNQHIVLGQVVLLFPQWRVAIPASLSMNRVSSPRELIDDRLDVYSWFMVLKKVPQHYLELAWVTLW